jgi:hypothetical protein
MTWLGGMVLFVVAVLPWIRTQGEPVRARFLESFAKRFRAVSWTCYGLLIVTGLVNLWMRGVRPAHFLQPEWRSASFGRILTLKLVLFVVAVFVTTLHEHLRSPWQARWLGRLSLLLGLAIVGLAIVLVRGL